MNPIDYIRQFYPIAKTVEDETGIFADALLAQSALETGYGKSVKGNNYFGIKGKGQLFRTKEYFPTPNKKFGKNRIISVTPVEKNGKTLYLYDLELNFSKYDSAMESFRDYAAFLKKNKRYAKALQQQNASDFLAEVARAGYATGTNYASTLQSVLLAVIKRIKIIENG